MSFLTRSTRPGARRALAGVVTVTASLALVACGGGEAETPDAPAEPAGGEATEEPEAWEPTGDIEMIVPYSAGGGFDTYARGLAQVMEEEGYLPDGVRIVVRNTTPLPQGLTAMFTADPDGHTVGILPMPGAVAMEIQEPDIARWETANYSVFGQVDENGYVVYVAGDSEYESIEDLIETDGLRSIAVDAGSSAGLAGRTAIAALGLDATMTYGAEGSSEAAAALIRGDADFITYGTTDLVGFVESGDIRPLLFLGTESQRPDDLTWLADVPSAESAGFPDLAGTVTELRIIAGPPELPEEVATWWSTAVFETVSSDAFAQWAATAERPIVPRDAQEAKASVDAQIERMEVLIPQLPE